MNINPSIKDWFVGVGIACFVLISHSTWAADLAQVAMLQTEGTIRPPPGRMLRPQLYGNSDLMTPEDLVIFDLTSNLERRRFSVGAFSVIAGVEADNAIWIESYRAGNGTLFRKYVPGSNASTPAVTQSIPLFAPIYTANRGMLGDTRCSTLLPNGEFAGLFFDCPEEQLNRGGPNLPEKLVTLDLNSGTVHWQTAVSSNYTDGIVLPVNENQIILMSRRNGRWIQYSRAGSNWATTAEHTFQDYDFESQGSPGSPVYLKTEGLVGITADHFLLFSKRPPVKLPDGGIPQDFRLLGQFLRASPSQEVLAIAESMFSGTNVLSRIFLYNISTGVFQTIVQSDIEIHSIVAITDDEVLFTQWYKLLESKRGPDPNMRLIVPIPCERLWALRLTDGW